MDTGLLPAPDLGTELQQTPISLGSSLADAFALALNTTWGQRGPLFFGALGLATPWAHPHPSPWLPEQSRGS